MRSISVRLWLGWLLFGLSALTSAQPRHAPVRVIGFFTARQDQAHIDFVHEANRWLAAQGPAHNFTYDSTSNWANLNAAFLSRYQVVVFLDSRPEAPAQRAAFEAYMQRGGGWLGFHFSAFALTPSAYPQNWNWYHQQFLGSGQYSGNTWRPTAATLRIDTHRHPVTQGLADTLRAAPNEWYRWQNDLRQNPDIRVLLSIDPSSFPLGTGPKAHEIWHQGDYPVVWTNRRYRMLYVNMGHNDIDYEHNSRRALSSTFSSTAQNRLILNGIGWLGRRAAKK